MTQDGQYFAALTSEGNVELWNTQTQQVMTLAIAPGDADNIQFSPNTNRLLVHSGASRTVTIWDETGSKIATLSGT